VLRKLRKFSTKGIRCKLLINRTFRRYRHQLEDLFYSYQVDLVVSGHNHNYERSYPTYQRKRVSSSYENPTAPVYIVVGSAGRGLDSPFRVPAPEWSVKESRIVAYGFGVVSTTMNQSLTWEWINAYTAQVQDSFTITRS